MNEVSRNEKARRRIENRVYRDAIGLPPESKWKSVFPLFTEQGFAMRVIRKRLKLPTPLNTTDRAVLETVIFPAVLADPATRDILFVGCDSYTAHYEREYFSQARYTTLEPDPMRACYGAARHIIAPLERLAQHTAAESYDLIVCNGVLGWGLDQLAQCEDAFAQCHDALRSGGLLILGWDDVVRRRPVEPHEIESLARFRRHTFPSFASWRYLTDTPFRHTYDFYRK